ncbi:MAG TPA: hypothetical protein VFP39_10590 [Gemmatimonadales bacterium]|nr:hypothetical protein [Gemmatimonadales bacterium]
MRRAVFATVGCALIAAAITPLRAQQASSACRLVQVPELEAAIGGKASGPPAGSKSSVPGMTVDECSMVLSGVQRHSVSVRIITDLGMDGAQAITIQNAGTAREEQWKTAGARLEQATVGKAICLLTGRPHVSSQTICRIPRGEGYLEVEVAGDVAELPSNATVAALAQKAFARL